MPLTQPNDDSPPVEEGDMGAARTAHAEMESHVGLPSLAGQNVNTQWIRLSDIILDVSVLRAVNKWCRDWPGFNPYWDEDHGFSVVDEGLLPLNRLDNMMSGSFLPPPIVIRRMGQKYCYANGRHRHARLLIHNMADLKNAVVRACDYVIEKNPGPPKRQPARQPAQARVAQNIRADVRRHHTTEVYIRGRDAKYPDAAALARFNIWVQAHSQEIDPAETKVCLICGQVDLVLCAHSITQPVAVAAPAAPQIIPAHLRHHKWKFQPLKALRDSIRLPSFDTHSMSDVSLHGFSNDDLSDELIVPELFSYLTLNMQTSYVVNRVEDRALRLSHVHRLAIKWLILRDLEKKVEEDHHYNVRVRLTVQRACDNMQNDMLYGSRNPARNFGLAWLPKSNARLFLLFLLVVTALWHWQTTIGLIRRSFEVIAVVVSLIAYLLSCLAASVPDLVPRIFVSAFQHQSGSMPQYQCVSTSYGLRWSVPNGDAHVVIQSCQYTDWVMAGINEVSYLVSEILMKIWDNMQEHRVERCLANNIYMASAQIMDWARLSPAGGSLWAKEAIWRLSIRFQSFIYRC
nr:hypothetical protein [Tolivirales sp.]